MGFKLGAFAKGFATQATKQIEADKQNARETFRIAYSNWLDKNDKETETRRTLQKKYETLGTTMKSFLNLDDAQALKILEAGPEMAELAVSSMLKAKQTMGSSFDPNTFVTAKDKSGLTLEAGIERLMGSLDTEGLGELPGMGEGNIFFSPERTIAREREQLEGMFGVTADEARAGARGRYKTEDLGIEGTVDFGALYAEDPMADLKRRKLIAEVKKLEEADIPKLPASDVRAFKADLFKDLSLEMGVDIMYNPDAPAGQQIKTSGGTLEQQQHAMNIARKSVSYMNSVLPQAKNIADAYALTWDYARDRINPKLVTVKTTEQSPQVQQPSETVDVKGEGARGQMRRSDGTTISVSEYKADSGVSPVEFALSEGERLGFAGKNQTQKAQIKTAIQSQLTANGVPIDEALQAVRNLK